MRPDHPERERTRSPAAEAQSDNDRFVRTLLDLVAAETGLQILERDQERFRRLIASRLKLLKVPEPEQYYRLLAVDTPESALEWKELTMLLTTGESYFFRDQGQFALLRTAILPELLERRKPQRSLRIWSAGCSTGEEPYSLAILLDQLLPRRDAWDIFILGTDLNSEAIERARRGIYSAWAFRIVDPALQQRYFRPRKGEWELDAGIRAMVTFRPGNLLKDVFPGYAADLHDMDLILCRNVFIYFDRAAVSRVLAKLTDTLRNDGYLMTGHNELHGQDPGQLWARVFSEGVVYRRSEARRSLPAPEAGLRRARAVPRLAETSTAGASYSLPTATVQGTTSDAALAEAAALLRAGAYARAVEKAAQFLNDAQRPVPPNLRFEAHYLMAQAHANLGAYEQAARGCEAALALDCFAVHPYYLLATIAEEQGDLAQAKNCLKRVLYLAPSSIAAYLELAALYEKERDAVRARKMRATALELLATLPPEVTIHPYPQVTAGELLGYVKRELQG